MKIHPAAAAGFSRAAARYAHGRPDYPALIDTWLVNGLELCAGRRVLDLGAGTGKFTRRLVATGASVLAADPVAPMLEQLRLSGADAGLICAAAEQLPLREACVDAVVCAQAFHWFANLRALTEIARVLRPGGSLVLIWNVRDETTAWVRHLTALIEPYEGDTPRHHQGEWRAVFPHPEFGALEVMRLAHEHTGAPEQVIVDRVLSVSFIAALPAPERRRVAARLRRLIASSPELADKAVVTVPYETVVYRCIRVRGGERER